MSTTGEGLHPHHALQSNSWYHEFADKLLSENFLLTALEFYAELIESGKELPKLKEFFSNPENFEHPTIHKAEAFQPVNLPRSSSQATLDSLDLTRYSEDGERSTDDRLAVLEFELRKAKETITALRANLTEAAELESSNTHTQEENIKENQTPLAACSIPIRPHEQRALNFLVNEYLLLHGYKLTSITFADENEKQDFEDWDDVGLNSARPVELLYLYREGLKGVNNSSSVETKDFECQVALYDEIKQNLQINELEAEVAQLSSKINSMSLDYTKKISSLEQHKSGEVDSQRSLTPDPEYFEMIETIKSNEESETKSDKSNGDWMKIGDKFKKESIDLKSDSQSNFDTISADDKAENQSGGFENDEIMTDYKAIEDTQEDIETQEEISVTKCSNIRSFPALDEASNEVCDRNSKLLAPLADSMNSDNQILGLMNSDRAIPDRFKNEILKHCDKIVPIFSNKIISNQWFRDEFLDKLTSENIVQILTNSLPKIIPNVILTKREEIIPLLILSICLNPELSARDKLLNLLFNLKKKPQAEERSVIVQSLIKIAQLKGSNTVENEILPQCWEQITNKYLERRMLAAESCFALAPYVSETIRNSLIISITQQLFQDREETIRKTSVHILTLLIALISQEEKYNQVLEICLQTLNDESVQVINVVNELLFPTLAQWSFSLNRVQSHLYGKLLSKIKKEKNLTCIKIVEILLPYLIMTVSSSERVLSITSTDHPVPAKRQEFCNLCKGLRDPTLFYPGSLGRVMGAFDFVTSQADFNPSDWSELLWIKNVFIIDLLEAGDNFWEDVTILKALMSTLRHLCLGLGKNITNSMIKPFLVEKLMECENAVVSGQDYKCAIIPLYLVGVLSTFPEELQEMSNTLRRFICALPLCGVNLTPLKVTFEILSQLQSWQILILDAIWEGVVHQRPLVRCGSASLLQYVIPHIPEVLVNSKVIPALVTLTSDPEPSVRTSAIPALGMLANANEKSISDKVCMTFQALLQECTAQENNSLSVQLVKTLGSIYEKSEVKFREEVVIPQISSISALAFRSKNRDLVEVLIDAFSIISFSQIQIPPQCASIHLLPALRNLSSLCSQMNLPQLERVNALIKDLERRYGGVKESQSKTPIKSPSEGKRLANVVSTNVEDVRNRVNKIFNAKPNTLQNVSGIFKKKT
ncbi:hypothetical protein RUM44_004826 [Polyplax serrata]|uniref:LisH domain-containing protein n=1 Tax=Polyplax serrata TaxID=468196 RepID=A0ABR1B5P3_POLSC